MSVEDITNGISERLHADTGSDYIVIDSGAATIQRIGSIILGFLIMLTLILVPVIISLEVMYIVFPIIRSSVDVIGNKMKGKGHAKQVAGFLFRDAITAITITETTRPGDNPLWIYLKIKIKTAMFLAFVIAMILQGSGPLIRFAAKILKGFINAAR